MLTLLSKHVEWREFLSRGVLFYEININFTSDCLKAFQCPVMWNRNDIFYGGQELELFTISDGLFICYYLLIKEIITNWVA